MRPVFRSLGCGLILLLIAPSGRADDALRAKAGASMKKAVAYFVDKVSCEGGYLWVYSEDLSQRAGENKSPASQVEAQPPGTPAVGLALLDAYRHSGEACLLDAAKKAGHCLARGQLRSGGWAHRFELDPAKRSAHSYRLDPGSADRKKAANISTLDDDTTQSCLRMLAELDQTLEFKDAVIHDAAVYGLARLLEAQHQNGGWPQVYNAPVNDDRPATLRASYPATWNREYSKIEYWWFYTFNDNTIADTIDLMFRVADIYAASDAQRAADYRRSAVKGADFILLAQMPEPQPAWAQQYDFDMHPAWARKFEPPSVTGGESQRLIRLLLQIYQRTGDTKYLEPIPRALAYLRKSLLPDGRLARFYELQTNRPLYFTTDYKLVYADNDLPTHYSFKIDSTLDGLEKQYAAVKQAGPAPQANTPPAKRKRSQAPARLRADVERIVAAQDAEGRWIEEGRIAKGGPQQPVITTRTFMINIRALAQYLAAAE